jgi:DNA-binding PadR family transcriptional regulator
MKQPSETPLAPAAFHILIALAEGPRHGYAILRDIAERTDGGFAIGPATLYTTIRRLLDGGLIKEQDAAGDDPRRRYYRLTPLGREAAAQEGRRLESLVAQMRRRFPAGAKRQP